MNAKTLFGLIVLAIALLLFSIFDPWQEATPPALGRLIAHTTIEEVSFLRVSGDSGHLEVRMSGDDHWSFADKDELVEQVEVARTVSALELLTALRLSPQRPDMGLATPLATIFIQNKKGNSLELKVGASSADGKFRWVQSSSAGGRKGKVALVEEHLVREVLASSKAWRSRKLFASGISQILSIRFSQGERTTTLSQGEIQWGKGPETGNARINAGAFETWKERLLRLELVRDAEGTCPSSELMFEIAVNHDSLRLRDCGLCSDTERRLQSGTREGCVSEEVWQDLLRVVTDPHFLVAPSPLPLGFGDQRFQAECGGQVLQIYPDKVDEKELAAWLRAVEESVLGIEKAQEFAPRCLLRGSFGEVAMGKAEDGGKWVARDPRESIQRVLRPDIASLLRADRFLFRSLLFVSEDPLFASRIAIGKEVQLTRGELLETWSMDGDGNDLIATQYALPIANSLGELSALSLEPKGVNLSGSTSFSVAISFEHPTQGSTRNYKLLVHSKGSTCQIQVAKGPVGNFEPRRCDLLLSSFDALLR